MKKLISLILASSVLCACSSVEDTSTVDKVQNSPHVGSESAMQPLVNTPAESAGTLQSSPSGAFVLVNDVYVGATPVGNLSLNQFDRVEIYKQGYEPLLFTLTTPSTPNCLFQLNGTNARIYNLLVSANARFVYRPEGLKLEPANLPVFTNAAFVIFDSAVGKDLQLNVKKITAHYVILQTNDGISCVYPILRGTPANPPSIPNSQPTASPYLNTAYGNAAMNPQAAIMPNVSFPNTAVPAIMPRYPQLPPKQEVIPTSPLPHYIGE